jgi:hypothetical protein
MFFSTYIGGLTVFFGITITNGEDFSHQCQISEQKIAKTSEWSKSILKSQDDERLNEILDKSRIDSKSKMEVVDKYYETAAMPIQGRYIFKIRQCLASSFRVFSFVLKDKNQDLKAKKHCSKDI